TVADLDGDVITDYGAGDVLLYLGASFGLDAVSLQDDDATLIGIDADHDGTQEAVTTLTASLADLESDGLQLRVVQTSQGTAISFVAPGSTNAPIAVNDDRTTVAGHAVVLTAAELLGNDIDIDGKALTLTGVQQAGHGTVVFDSVAGIVTY